MTNYDYAVLVFYFVSMVAIGWIFRRFVTNVSDYFRGGGKALWWMVGGSAFMVQFSAWTFTGAASKAYTDGWPIAVIYLGNVFGFLLNALYFAPRFRQLRVVTGVEAIRHRFGRVSEQFFTWTQLPFGFLQAGIWLNSLAVFFSAIFGIDLTLTIAVTGAVVLLMALVGGSWAVLASDFIQVLILMPVCLAVTILSILKVGGISSFIDRAPAGHLDLGQLGSTNFLALWCVAMLLKQLHTTNNLADANRYLCVKDSRHARWAGFLGAALFVIGIVIWFVPPIAASIRFPDLHAIFPQLKNPEEAAFIAIARDVMPVGMMGLLVSGIFAATMSSMDSGLNKNTGFFIKNFYQPVLRPAATDQHLLYVGKIATFVFGVLIILVALKMSQLKDLSLFQLTQRLSILIGIPIIVPLFIGLLVKHTPPWSAWSTVIVGFVSSLFITDQLTPEWAATYFHLAAPLDASGREYWRQAIELFGNVAVCTTWFVGTKFFWSRTSPARQARVIEFFERLSHPVDYAKEEGAASANDARQESVVGWLCLGYGGFIMLLALIPNDPLGRLAFLGCGGVVILVGLLLRAASKQPAS
ncbi:MAG: transporter [Opitutaceae bacterium]